MYSMFFIACYAQGFYYCSFLKTIIVQSNENGIQKTSMSWANILGRAAWTLACLSAAKDWLEPAGDK